MVGSWTNYQKKSSAYWLSSMVVCCRAFSHDVTAAMLVFQNNKTAAMLVSQTNPVGIELFSYVNAFFCSCWPREWIPGILRFSPASKEEEVPSFPSPSPFIPIIFALAPTSLDELARKRLLRRLNVRILTDSHEPQRLAIQAWMRYKSASLSIFLGSVCRYCHNRRNKGCLPFM